MNEAEYLMKNYGDRGGCYRRITPSVPLVLVAIFGSSLVLTVIITSPSLRSLPPIILLSGLAVSDLTVGF